MKRVSEIILVLAFAVFTIGQVSAQDNTAAAGNNDQAKQTTIDKQGCGKFVDANQDGICDNKATHQGNAKGANFVDANSDGICDHHADGTSCKGNGNCCKDNCQHKQDCQKGQQGCCGQAKGTGAQHRSGCESQCKTPCKK